VIRLVQKEAALYRLDGPLKLRVARGAALDKRLDFAAALIAKLTAPAPARPGR
jgi:hypothetical protein